MKETIVICGAQRGKWGRPIPYKKVKHKIKWVDEEDKPIKPHKKVKCQHPDHFEKKSYFPVSEMYWQRWEMTEEELKDAIREFDIFSLEMGGRIICPSCAKKEIRKSDKKRR